MRPRNEILELILANSSITPSSLLLRYDETSIKGTAQAVTGWGDIALVNDPEFDLITNGTGAEPTLETVNNIPAIHFNLGKFMTLSAAIRKDRPVTTIVVFKAMSTIDGAGGRFIFDGNDPSSQNFRHFAFQIENNGGFSGGIGGATAGNPNGVQPEDLEVHVMMQKVYADTCEIIVDNVLIARTNNGPAAVDWLTLGADFLGNRPFDGFICQIEAYEGIPAFMDDRAAELLDKWREIPLPVITLHPSSETVNDGDIALLLIQADNEDSYQWWFKLLSTGVWQVMTGEVNANLITPPLSGGVTGIQFRCDAINTRGKTTSTAATITVRANPFITTQPLTQTVAVGVSTTMSCGGTDITHYQWQLKPTAGANWSNFGAEREDRDGLNTFQLGGLELNQSGLQLRCSVRRDDVSGSDVMSDIATITVATTPKKL